ncbi:MAG: hypothetical protein QM698_03715 [Micropepsaceae bacterium]
MFLTVLIALTPVTPEAPALPALPDGPAMVLEEAVKGALRAAGTEPFWGLDIDPKTLKLSVPGEEGDVVTEYLVEYSTGLGENRVITSGPLTVTLSPAVCSDGMSDFVYPYTVEAVLTGKDAVTLKGCAYRPWGQDVVAALPVIDACLKGEKDFPAIVYARATAADAGYVIMPGGEASPTQTCTVAAGKAAKAPQADDAALPAGTNAEIFVRGPGENPGGECYEAPEVKDADGKVVGWWLDPEGC